MKISIVMPSLNQRPFLSHALDSVLRQQGPFELELHVIDGGSTDGSLDILRQIADPRLHWTSEPDAGQADAINKGLARATGDVVAWLNSDDEYAPGALAHVAEAFTRQPEAQWLVGRCEVMDEHGQTQRSAITRYKNRALDGYSYRRLLRENYISQMAVFWRRGFGGRVGPVDAALHYTMDYDLWLRMGRLCDPLVIGPTLARFRVYPRSKTGQVRWRQFQEEHAVAVRHAQGGGGFRAHRRARELAVFGAYRLMRLLGW